MGGSVRHTFAFVARPHRLVLADCYLTARTELLSINQPCERFIVPASAAASSRKA